MENRGRQGHIRGVNLVSFVQMVKMGRKTCRIEVHRSFDGEKGFLHFTSGRLLDAVLDDLPPKEAALRILAWQDVYIRIGTQRGGCRTRIDAPLMELMMEVARHADERRDEAPRSNGHFLDAPDDSPCEADLEGSDDTESKNGNPLGGDGVPHIVLEDGAMRGLSELLARFNELAGFEGIAVYSPGGELKGFFLPVSSISRIFGRGP